MSFYNIGGKTKSVEILRGEMIDSFKKDLCIYFNSQVQGR